MCFLPTFIGAVTPLPVNTDFLFFKKFAVILLLLLLFFVVIVVAVWELSNFFLCFVFFQNILYFSESKPFFDSMKQQKNCCVVICIFRKRKARV